MNTKSLPAILALVAGFITCILSFMQRVDIFVFAKRFMLVCIIFYCIGIVIRIIININFKEPPKEETQESNEEEMENTEGAESEEETIREDADYDE